MTIALPQSVSIKGAKFICCREALVTRAYPDGEFDDGTPRFSLAFGSQTPRVKEGETITIEQAFPRLLADIASREPDVNRVLKIMLSQPQFDALFSLYYQAGWDELKAVADLFNDGTPGLATRQFAEYYRDSKGRVKEGLARRRCKEIALAENGDYGDISRFPFYDGDPHFVRRQYKPFPETL